jgi:hypothetical protein
LVWNSRKLPLSAKKFFLLLTLAGFIAACMPQVPPSPQVVVEVTVIDADEDVINEAVAAALTSTASSRVALTETALAEAGITLTPTATATGTATPLPPTATPARWSQGMGKFGL